MNLLSIKAIRIYKLIALILFLSVLFTFMYLAYENYRVYKVSTVIEPQIDNVIQEWTLQYAKDIQDLNKIHEDLIQSEMRLRILYKKAGLEYD